MLDASTRKEMRKIDRQLRREGRQRTLGTHGLGLAIVVAIVAGFGWWNYYRISEELDIACSRLASLSSDWLDSSLAWAREHRACECANGNCEESADN